MWDEHAEAKDRVETCKEWVAARGRRPWFQPSSRLLPNGDTHLSRSVVVLPRVRSLLIIDVDFSPDVDPQETSALIVLMELVAPPSSLSGP